MILGKPAVTKAFQKANLSRGRLYNHRLHFYGKFRLLSGFRKTRRFLFPSAPITCQSQQFRRLHQVRLNHFPLGAVDRKLNAMDVGVDAIQFLNEGAQAVPLQPTSFFIPLEHSRQVEAKRSHCLGLQLTRDALDQCQTIG